MLFFLNPLQNKLWSNTKVKNLRRHLNTMNHFSDLYMDETGI